MLKTYSEAELKALGAELTLIGQTYLVPRGSNQVDTYRYIMESFHKHKINGKTPSTVIVDDLSP